MAKIKEFTFRPTYGEGKHRERGRSETYRSKNLQGALRQFLIAHSDDKKKFDDYNPLPVIVVNR